MQHLRSKKDVMKFEIFRVEPFETIVFFFLVQISEVVEETNCVSNGKTDDR